MDHGGDLDRAMGLYGGSAADWLDLSTGINRIAYPVPNLSHHAWTALPTRSDMARLCEAARRHYGTRGSVVPLNGAQSAIQMLPGLRAAGTVRIVGPTYNEYARVFTDAGWRVETVSSLAALRGADIGIVVNPNNPDGRVWGRSELIAASAHLGLLVVDESFADATPELSVADCGRPNLLVLRSFGKFFGLAGLRLGFALGDAALCELLAARAGPWPVNGAAIEVATAALEDRDWIDATRTRLGDLSREMDLVLPFPCVGGTPLFRLYDVGDASAVQHRLAQRQIWTRSFPWSDRLLRLGVCSETEIGRLAAAAAETS